MVDEGGRLRYEIGSAAPYGVSESRASLGYSSEVVVFVMIQFLEKAADRVASLFCGTNPSEPGDWPAGPPNTLHFPIALVPAVGVKPCQDPGISELVPRLVRNEASDRRADGPQESALSRRLPPGRRNAVLPSGRTRRGVTWSHRTGSSSVGPLTDHLY